MAIAHAPEGKREVGGCSIFLAFRSYMGKMVLILSPLLLLCMYVI